MHNEYQLLGAWLFIYTHIQREREMYVCNDIENYIGFKII